jgi:hypothetical protein
MLITLSPKDGPLVKWLPLVPPRAGTFRYHCSPQEWALVTLLKEGAIEGSDWIFERIHKLTTEKRILRGPSASIIVGFDSSSMRLRDAIDLEPLLQQRLLLLVQPDLEGSIPGHPLEGCPPFAC